ncbi:cell envelope integrity EipB family protein [Rhizobium sp. CSW-27]|uniref:cell envelope integrity EipB family protein n=1 Tax=Rhizobium sp. CSW-27 TaxID=2839985 RepID=UPI001C032B24|nr:cell envelope integrity EipB family protein [Rhizobium sp. CSW-27]MBT9370231.1 cell envelope integrity EipB family protein [Rhizobium sp. CSW-27]
MLRQSLASVLMAGSLLAAVSPARAGMEGARTLIPHRAVYDLKLKDVSERSGIEGMYGRMVYEFTGSACAGYTTHFRFVTRVDTGEDMRLTDQQTTTFENLKAGSFRFDTKSFTDDKLDRQVTGEASDEATGIKVALAKPDARQVELTPAQFPTEHMLEVIDNARKGKRFFEERLFDGSEDGDQSLLTTTVIGKQQMPAADDADAGNAGEFAGQPYWPVTIAYYDEDQKTDSVPIYRMSFKLYENGITRDLTMDYGDFVLSGTLSKLEVLGTPASNCP